MSVFNEKSDKTNRQAKKCQEKSSPADNTLFVALSPEDEIQNGQEYMDALDWALQQDDICNVAISGPYGSGKSSVLKSYFKSRNRNDVLNISLAAFNLEEMKQDDQQSSSKLETGILKQLFYKVKADKIPESRYRKLQPSSKCSNVKIALPVTILVLALAAFISPDRITSFISLFDKLSFLLKVILYTGIFCGLWMVAYYVVKWIRRNGNLHEINILDKATVRRKDAESESIFDKNMDEIMYFFEVTKYRVVVIEDLDRFESTNIFVALRELNNLLNNYEEIKEKVTFIYAIKDDMFQKEGERTKFFDFIIPIVPYVSSTNSGEILRHNLQVSDVSDKSKLYDISGKYISLISPYISDMRELTSICNEFIIFKNTLKGNQQLNLIDEQLFSLIVFKNLYPREFAQLEDESQESIVRRAFHDKARLISDKHRLLAEKKKEQEEIIHKLERESNFDIRDLKVVLLSCAMGFQSAVRLISYERETLGLEDIYRDDFDIETLKHKQLTVQFASRNNISTTTIPDLEKRVADNGGDYFERIYRVKAGLEKCREESRRKIESFERELNELRACSISQIIERFGTDFFDETVRKNDLLVFLLRNGFLREDYEDYINYFHPSSISKEEMNFILGVRNHRAVGDFAYPLKNVQKVFSRLQDYEFRQREILNFDLVDYAITYQHESSAVKKLIEQLSDRSAESMSFIKAYFDRNENIGILLKDLCKANPSLWEDLSNDNGISVDTRFAYLNALIEYADIADIIALDGAETEGGILSSFLTSYPDLGERLHDADSKKLKMIFERLDIHFDDLITDHMSEDLKQDIFDNCRYVLNENMLQRLVEWRSPELAGSLFTKNYTTIRKLGYKPLLDYIERDFVDYVKRMVLGVESNTQEEIGAVEELLKKLLPSQPDLCIAILEKEPVVWNCIAECCPTDIDELKENRETIWNYLLANDRIVCKWDNLKAYFHEFGASEVFVEYFERNVDFLVIVPDGSEETIIYALIESNLTEGVFRKLTKSLLSTPYTRSLSSLDQMKIRVLVEESSIPFTAAYWQEMEQHAPEIRTLFALMNKEAFISNLTSIDLTELEIDELLQSDAFNEEEKKSILERISPSVINIETARIIRNLSFEVEKKYVEASWELLPDEEKYQLLLNQIDCYNDSELASKFSELSPVYHQLSMRTKHKYTLAYSDYNRVLLEKLRDRSYVTSVEDTWVEKDKHGLFKNQNEHVLTGYVKQATH